MSERGKTNDEGIFIRTRRIKSNACIHVYKYKAVCVCVGWRHATLGVSESAVEVEGGGGTSMTNCYRAIGRTPHVCTARVTCGTFNGLYIERQQLTTIGNGMGNGKTSKATVSILSAGREERGRRATGLPGRAAPSRALPTYTGLSASTAGGATAGATAAGPAAAPPAASCLPPSPAAAGFGCGASSCAYRTGSEASASAALT